MARDQSRGTGKRSGGGRGGEPASPAAGGLSALQGERGKIGVAGKQGGKAGGGGEGEIRAVRGVFEILCFFLVGRLVRRIRQGGVAGNGFFLSVTPGGLQGRLVKGKRSRVTFVYRQ